MITCGWCRTHYSTWQNRCDSCGGPMPAMPGCELGSAPPPAPRVLPSGYAFRVRWSRNALCLVGSGFVLIAAFLLAALLAAKSWGALFPAVFIVIGAALFRFGRSEADARLRALVRGIAVAGEVTGVRLDRSQSVNGEHPWKLTYRFTANGYPHEGSLTSFDGTLASRAAGQPVWILYVTEDPTQNTPYPPVV